MKLIKMKKIKNSILKKVFYKLKKCLYFYLLLDGKFKIILLE